MKRSLVFFMLLLILYSCDSTSKKQSDIETFYSQNFNDEGIPLDVERVIIKELINTDSGKIRKITKQILTENGLGETNSKEWEVYLKDYKIALAESNQIDENSKFFSYVSDQIDRQGIHVFNDLSNSKLTKEIQFILPGTLKIAFTESVDSLTRDVMNGIMFSTTKNYILLRTNLLHQNGINLIGLDRDAFKKEFNSASKGIKAVETDSLFGKAISDVAFDILNKGKKFKYTEFNKTEIRNKIRFINSKSNQLQAETSKSVQNQLDSITNSFERLIKNEETAVRIADTIYNQAKKYDDKIKNIEKQIKSPTLSNAARENLNEQLQKYVKANYIITKILQDYQMGELDSKIILSSFNNEYINAALTVDGSYSEIKASIQNLANVNLQTLSTVSMTVCENLQSTTSELQNLGLLKGNDAKNVGKFIKYLSGSVQVGTGVAKAFSGDPSGVFNIVSGLSGMFGNNSAQPTAEEQMMKHMDARFDRIDSQLDSLDKKINALTNLTIDLYKSMDGNFKIVQDKLERIQQEILEVKDATRLVLYHQYYTCDPSYQADSYRYNRYKDYITKAGSLTNCLAGLRTLTTPNTNNSYFFFAQNGSNVLPEVHEFNRLTYSPLVEYFNISYLSKNARLIALYSGLFPASENQRITPAEIVSKTLTLIPGDNSDVFSNVINNNKFIDVNFLYIFTNTYLRYSNYFIFYKSSIDFVPYTLSEYLNLEPNLRSDKTNEEIKYLMQLYKACNYALIQQSLISGNQLIDNLLNTITGTQKLENKQIAFAALRNNLYLNRNYKKALLRDRVFSMGKPGEFFKVYSEVFSAQNNNDEKLIKESIISFNQKIEQIGQNNYVQLAFDEKGNQINVVLKAPDVKEDLVLIAPFPEDVLDSKILKTPGVVMMLDLQNKLRKKIISSSFNTFLAKGSSKSRQVFKALLTQEILNEK
jgi:cyclophilin family peptidyl-prolyl cis-trans isomerase